MLYKVHCIHVMSEFCSYEGRPNINQFYLSLFQSFIFFIFLSSICTHSFMANMRLIMVSSEQYHPPCFCCFISFASFSLRSFFFIQRNSLASHPFQFPVQYDSSSTILLTFSLLETHWPCAIATSFVPCRLRCRQIFIIHMWKNIRVVLVGTPFGSTLDNFFLWAFPSSFELCVLRETKFI